MSIPRWSKKGESLGCAWSNDKLNEYVYSQTTAATTVNAAKTYCFTVESQATEEGLVFPVRAVSHSRQCKTYVCTLLCRNRKLFVESGLTFVLRFFFKQAVSSAKTRSLADTRKTRHATYKIWKKENSERTRNTVSVTVWLKPVMERPECDVYATRLFRPHYL